MKLLSLIAAAGLLVSPAAAQNVDWGDAPRVEIRILGNRYDPATVRLAAGQPVVLRIHNLSRDSHVFSARGFFDAALVRPEDRSVVTGGAVDLEGRETREVALVPVVGRFAVRCSQQYHETLGEKGAIFVE